MPEKDGWTIRVTQEGERARIIARGETFSFIFECPGTIIFNGPPTEEPKAEQPQVETRPVAPTPEPAPQPQTEAPAEAKAEKKDGERIDLTGWLAHQPKRKEGSKALKATIYVHGEGEETKRYGILWTGEKADKAEEELGKFWNSETNKPRKPVQIITYKREGEEWKKINGQLTKVKADIYWGAKIIDPTAKKKDTHDFKHSYPKE